MRKTFDRRVVADFVLDFVRACQRRVPCHLGGGAALAGAYLGHRTTGDIDLFVHDAEEMRALVGLLPGVAAEAGFRIERARFTEPVPMAEAWRRSAVDLVDPALPENERRGIISLDEVIARINAAPKPLALYLWSRDAATADKLRTETSSGSFCVNLCVMQFAHGNLPFGGVNHSGLGNAHGFFGFKAFSHERAVLKGGPLSALKLLFPPYTEGKAKLSRMLLAMLRRL